ncbi:hypothetical protein INH39_17160 [Massilia violaceinigra]|uniref:Uncharacterized protein n=1 Tax=Massilia violaceinigra TaxID=2045208 RepID=A0ABY3ZXU2_9BURK|nr:hypothetical protein [Massilia violaceinigra]UOD27265.1 hypothetical protein INH39_17160 [Massilia violaceinigra]
MSLDLVISCPINQEERALLYPICSEGTFDNVILPISLKYELHMIEDWHPFVHVCKENLDEFLRQMEILIHHIHVAIDDGDMPLKSRIFFDDRLYGMIDLIKELLDARSDLIVSIG